MTDPHHTEWCSACAKIVRVNDEGVEGERRCPYCNTATMYLEDALMEKVRLLDRIQDRLEPKAPSSHLEGNECKPIEDGDRAPSYKAWCLGCRKVVHVDDIPLAGALMCPKCTLPMMDLEEALEAMAEWWSRVDRGEIELRVSGKVRSCKGCLNVWPIDMTKCPACGGENFDPKTYSPAPTGFEARGCGQPIRPPGGPMKFGDDWAGVFFRGDQAFFFSVMVERALVTVDDTMTRAALQGLIESLKSCIEDGTDRVEAFQRLKPYAECVEDKK